jgi:hypothetical protein
MARALVVMGGHSSGPADTRTVHPTSAGLAFRYRSHVSPTLGPRQSTDWSCIRNLSPILNKDDNRKGTDHHARSRKKVPE